MRGLDLRAPGQVGDGARQLEDAVERPGAHLELLHRRPHQAAPRRVQLAHPPYLTRPHVGVAGQGRPLEALALRIAGALDALADRLRCLAQSVVRQLVVVDPRHLHVDVDPVQKRPADALLVSGHLGRGARTFSDGIAIEAAGAGVHGPHQREVGREGERPRRPGDHHLVILHRLAEHFERAPVELGQLVQEQDPAMGQTDLPRLRPASPAHQAGVADGVMRRAERPMAHQGRLRRQHAQDAVDLRHLQGFVDGHRGENGGHRAGQERLSGARRTAHQDVVRSSSGYLQGSLDVLLSLDLGEVGRVRWGRGGHRIVARIVGRDLAQPQQVSCQLAHVLDRDDVQIPDQGGLASVVGGDDQGGDALLPRNGRDGEDPVDVAHGPVERELADDQRVLHSLGPHLLRGHEHAHGDGEIVGRALLPDVCGGQVHGDALRRVHQARILDGRANALSRLLHGRIGKSDDRKPGDAAGGIDLDLDDDAVEALQGAAGHFSEHRWLLEGSQWADGVKIAFQGGLALCSSVLPQRSQPGSNSRTPP